MAGMVGCCALMLVAA